MKKIYSFFLLLGLLLSVGNAWATTSTLTFTEKCNGSGTADDGVVWTVTSDGTESTFDGDRGIHYGTNKAAVQYIQLSTSQITSGTITSVVVNASGNNNPSLSVTIGGNAFGTTQTNLTTLNAEYTFTGSAAAGEIVVLLTKSASANKALYVKSVAVTYTTAPVTPTCATPTFTPAAGAYTSAQNVSIACTTEGSVIHYTTDGADPTEQSAVYSSPIAVTATTTIKAIAVADGYDNSAIATAEYNIVNIEHAGTQQDPYTIADARNAIDANIGITNVYATGIVSEIVTAYGYNNYQNVTFNFSADGETTSAQLQAFRCVGDDADEVAVGDVVVVSGNLTKYNSTYEFAQGCEVVYLQHPAVTVEAPTFSPEAGTYTSAQNVTLSCSTDGATIYYTTDGTDPTNASTQYTAAIPVSTYSTIKAIAIKGNDQSTIASATYHICSAQNPYTVTQALAFAEYPANGIYVQGIVSTAPTAAPNNGALTYYISVDGETTNQLQIYKGKDLENAAFTAQDDIQVGDEVTVYGNVKIYNQTKEFDAGNYLVAFNRPVVPSITVSSNTINATSAETDGAIDVTYNNLTNFLSEVRFVASDGTTPATYDWFDAEINAQDNTELDYTIGENTGNARTAYMVVYAVGDEGDATSELITISQEAYVPPTPAANYVLVTDAADIVPGAHYIIASGTNGDIKIMGEQKTNNRGVQNVTAVDGVINIPAGAETHEFVICKDGDKFAIYEAGVGYLYAASSGNNYLKSQATNNVNGQWDITIDDQIASIVATESTNRNVMRYNTSGTGLFNCYASATQSPVYLYRKTGETFTTETVTISEVGYATLYYGEENLIVPEHVTAYIFNTTDGLKKAYDAGEVIPKTVGVVLEGPVGNYDFVVTPVVGMGPAANNLKGSDAEELTTGGTYYYGLSLNLAGEANSIGFYWMTLGGGAFTNGAHKAYLALNELPAGAPERILFNNNDATNINNIDAIEDAVKFMENGQLFIKKNGVIYNAVGAVVK